MRSKLAYFQLLCFSVLSTACFAQQAEHAPQLVFENGEAQVVPEFSDPETWITEQLWVETTFDSDNDGKMDRMHVYVTRPAQTQTSDIKLPIVYMPSPYYGLKFWALLGISKGKSNWNVKHELGEKSKSHKHKRLGTRKKKPIWMPGYDRMWVPRGYITVYSSSPGTGFSDGAPTVGGENESLASKCVIDWLCGRAKAFTTRDGNTETIASWSSGKIGMTGTSYNGTGSNIPRRRCVRCP